MKLYLAYFDSLGFESIIDLTDLDKKATWSILKGEKPGGYEVLPYLVLRAKANPQRFPEIYSFWTDLDIETLRQYTSDSPQEFADLLREKGNPVFVTPKQKELIR